MREYLTVERALPRDRSEATLIGRAWLPGEVPGPAVIALRGDDVHDLTAHVPTVSELVRRPDRLTLAREAPAPRVCAVADLLANAEETGRDPAKPWPLAPVDLQAVKAAGVTFVKSMLERVIEERAKGDPALADSIRARIESAIGGSLRSVRPGSPEAMTVKNHLVAEGLWSQYLEVGIGPDAEIFTKAQPMSSVGTGAGIGIHPISSWNNPEPEVVLVVTPEGEIVGATLGNDVNLRDVEGRSALLLGCAKDNNASSAIGPFIRLFDERFGIERVDAAEIRLEVKGRDGFVLEGASSMREISRKPVELVRQLVNPNHQYPDGAVLFCGTMFAPIQDRDGPGQGFTHHVDDVVAIACADLGTLVNRVDRCDRLPPWTFGTGALMANLARRGLLRG